MPKGRYCVKNYEESCEDLVLTSPLLVRPQEEEPTRLNWDMKKDGARLIMYLVLLCDEFLKRDATLPRTYLDAGQMNPFWDKCAETFNGNNEFLDTMLGDQDGRFTRLGLNSTPTGFVAMGAILKTKFTELRAAHMAIMVIFLYFKRLCAESKRAVSLCMLGT